MQIMLIKKNLNTQTYHPWMIFEWWYFDIALIFFVQLHLMDSNVQFQAPMQLWKVLHRQLCLFKLLQQGYNLFQAASMHFVGWTPPPMPNANDAQKTVGV